MGLTVSNTTVTALGQRYVTKADSASTTILGSGNVNMSSGSANTYGIYYQLVASTAAESYITALGIALPSSVTPVLADMPITMQVSMGAAASEVVKLELLIPLITFTAGHSYVVPLDVPFRVTASKRLAARMKSATTTAIDLTVTVYGLPISQTEGN